MIKYFKYIYLTFSLLLSSNSFYKAAANAAIRAVKDSEPIPLPASKFKEWRTLTFRFDPATMFGGY